MDERNSIPLVRIYHTLIFCGQDVANSKDGGRVREP